MSVVYGSFSACAVPRIGTPENALPCFLIF